MALRGGSGSVVVVACTEIENTKRCVKRHSDVRMRKQRYNKLAAVAEPCSVLQRRRVENPARPDSGGRNHFFAVSSLWSSSYALCWCTFVEFSLLMSSSSSFSMA